jgi:hypothetical protein
MPALSTNVAATVAIGRLIFRPCRSAKILLSPDAYDDLS